MHNFIEVQGAEMVFETRKGRFHALQAIDLKVARGEFVTLIGHSGCGKSTLLNLIAGLLRPTQGTLLCDNREIAAPGRRAQAVEQERVPYQQVVHGRQSILSPCSPLNRKPQS